MKYNDSDKFRRIGFICGIIMILCGLGIIAVSIFENDFETWRTFISAPLFIVAGLLNIIANRQKQSEL